MYRPAPRTIAAVALASSSILLATTVPTAVAAPAQDPSEASSHFRDAVTTDGIMEHLEAFQGIADANNDTRASGTDGFDASVDYVVEKLEAAGYDPTVQEFDFIAFAEESPTQLSQTFPDPQDYADGEEYSVMEYSGSGDVTDADVVAVDTDFSASETSTSGCETEDFADFPEGAIALIQRGTCTFAEKAQNALDAGAAAALIFNRGTEGNDGVLFGTLGGPIEGGEDFPVVGLDYATGVDLGDPEDTRASVFTETTNTPSTSKNVIADTPGGKKSNTVMVGAHLDSVPAGPGINDNGSGSATILEVAEQLAAQGDPVNRVRFAWWGAEEAGLVGSTHYVEDLAANDKQSLNQIAMYLNFDMIGSPNFVRFVYDGDNSLGEGQDGPDGSAQLEQLFTSYFDSQGLASEPTAFDGRSDYGPFLDAGIAAGGLFTGAEDIKTQEQADVYGGTAGEPYDPCYHLACDTIDNVDEPALDEMSDAVAHAVYVLSRSTKTVNKKGQKLKADKSEMKGHSAQR